METAMQVCEAGDLQVAYDDSGIGPTLLLVHGNWAERSWWRPLQESAPAGLRLIAYDLRGRGETRGPDHTYRIVALADDLWAFVDALGLTAVHLVGHSLGAAVVLEAALRAPQRTQSVTVIAPAWVDGMPDSYFSPERQRLLAQDIELFARAIRVMAPSYRDETAWPALIARGHRQRLNATIGAQHALRDWHPAEELRQLSMPRLVIGGALDPLITPVAVQRCADVLQVRPVLLDGVGHSANLEAPQQVWQVLLPLILRATRNARPD